MPDWTVEEWVAVATARRAARSKGKQVPLPTAVDTLLQLETADRLEAAGRHDEAVAFASNAVEECPGNPDVLLWEERLLAGDHDPGFNCHNFMYGRYAGTDPNERDPIIQSEPTGTPSEGLPS